MLFRKKPLISIIVPSFNQGKFIERTILSILNQPYQNKELIVMDGGSTDETVKILKKYDNQITWVSEPDEGYADAVNKALKLATGDIIGIQSSDDYYAEDIFNTVAKLFMLNKQIGMVSARRNFIDADGIITGKDPTRPTQIHTFTDFLTLSYIPFQDTTFVKKALIEEVGGVNKEVDFFADVDLWMRILGNGHVGLVIGDQYWSYRIMHDERRGAVALEKIAEAAKKSYDMWVNSNEFPHSLYETKELIISIGFIRRAIYFSMIGKLNNTKMDLSEAIHLYPSVTGIPIVSELITSNNFDEFEVIPFSYQEPIKYKKSFRIN